MSVVSIQKILVDAAEAVAVGMIHEFAIASRVVNFGKLRRSQTHKIIRSTHKKKQENKQITKTSQEINDRLQTLDLKGNR